MARPSPKVMDEFQKGNVLIEVLEKPNVYFVTYKGKPIGLRHSYFKAEGITLKYPKTAFNELAHCQRLADKLNTQFSCADFGVGQG